MIRLHTLSTLTHNALVRDALLALVEHPDHDPETIARKQRVLARTFVDPHPHDTPRT